MQSRLKETTEELLRRVVGLFSYEGQWVIDLLGTAGEALNGIFQLRILYSQMMGMCFLLVALYLIITTS